MQRIVSFHARSAVLAVAVLALSACDDHIDPNSPSARRNNAGCSASSHESIAQRVRNHGPDAVEHDARDRRAVRDVHSQDRNLDAIVQGFDRARLLRATAGATSSGRAGSSMRLRRQDLHVYEFHSGVGLLPGPAVFELQLFSATGSLLSTRDVPITLVEQSAP